MGNKVPQMVSGLGMAMRLISSLNDELTKRGGHEEMLHFLTTEKGSENLTKVAAFIVSLPWRVPRSVIMKFARELSFEEWGTDHLDSDEHFFWAPALTKLGIPYITFASDKEKEPNDYRREELHEQLHGKTLPLVKPIRWNDDEYWVVGINNRGDNPMPGDILNMDDDHTYSILLTPVQYIDPDR